MKKTFTLLIVILLLFCTYPAFAETKVNLDGQELTFDVPPTNLKGRVMVPLRKIFESLGAEVNWDGALQKITATKDSTVITLFLDNTTAIVNGENIPLDVPATLINGRTMVPTRFIAESLGATVQWDGASGTVIINSTKSTTVQINNGDSIIEKVPFTQENLLDSDNDGLADIHEKYKYGTNPNRKDTDNDGTPDNDWNERREYSYSVKARMKIVKPWDTNYMNDDYQDVKVLSENNDYLELEVVYYPFADYVEELRPNSNWKKDYALMKDYLVPGITTNWDEKMQADLIAELKKYGIDPDKLSDVELVEKVSQWAVDVTKSLPGEPLDFFIYYPNGLPKVYPQLRAAFEEAKQQYDPSWSDEDAFNHYLLGKEMYYNKTRGSCSSTATYLATIFKALGIPTRIVSTVPLLDRGDQKQIDMATENIIHRIMWSEITLYPYSQGFTNHFMNEVYVGNRWVRLDSDILGAGIRNLGLLFHVDTFRDFSEIPLAETWGKRLAGLPSPKLSSINPYQLLEISDNFGKHSTILQKEPDLLLKKEFKGVMEITKTYTRNTEGLDPWLKGFMTDRTLYFDTGIITDNYGGLQYFAANAGNLYLEDGEGNRYLCRINGTCTAGEGDTVKYITELDATLKPGVYKIVPENNNSQYRWVIKSDLIVE